MQILPRLDEIFADYDALFCDVWGVVHNGRDVYAPACSALVRARRAGKLVVLVTNVPKPRDPIPGQLDRLGAPREAWDAIVTSGDAIRTELAKRAPGPMYRIGPGGDQSLWEGLGLVQSDFNAASFIGISGLNDDNHETPDDYAELLTRARARDMDLVCANPDIVVRVGDRLHWCAGAIARDYAKLGGHVVMAGKPHPPIYEEALRELARVAGRQIPKGRILAIGDGVATDALGANRAGFDCLFIASGMHGEALFTDGAPDPTKIEAALAGEGARAQYAMGALG